VDVPVPEDGLCLEDDVTVELLALRASVETLPAIRNTLCVGGMADLWNILAFMQAAPGLNIYLSVLIELVSGDIVDREYDLDFLGLSLLKETGHLLGAILVEDRVTDLASRGQQARL
jgi:predicted naringenin-chalcone synthase